MRDRNIVHRDLKPNNILVKRTKDGEILKLSDFGFTRTIEEDEVMHSIVGTELYMAPEVYTGKYTSTSDLYSVGVIFYQFLTAYYKPLQKPIVYPSDISPNALDLLKKLLQPEDKRIKWDEFFAHPFLDLKETNGDINSWMQDIFYFNGCGLYHQVAVNGHKNIEYLKKLIKNDIELPIAYHDLMVFTKGECLPDDLILCEYISVGDDRKIPELFVVDRSNFHLKYNVNFEVKKHYVEEIFNDIKLIGFCERRIAKALRDYCLNQLEQHITVSEILFDASHSLVDLLNQINNLIDEVKDFKIDKALHNIEVELSTNYDSKRILLKDYSLVNRLIEMKESSNIEKIVKVYNSLKERINRLKEEKDKAKKYANLVDITVKMNILRKTSNKKEEEMIAEAKSCFKDFRESVRVELIKIKETMDFLDGLMANVELYEIIDILKESYSLKKMVNFKKEYEESIREIVLRREWEERFEKTRMHKEKIINDSYAKEIERRRKFNEENKDVLNLFPILSQYPEYEITRPKMQYPVGISSDVKYDEIDKNEIEKLNYEYLKERCQQLRDVVQKYEESINYLKSKIQFSIYDINKISDVMKLNAMLKTI